LQTKSFSYIYWLNFICLSPWLYISCFLNYSISKYCKKKCKKKYTSLYETDFNTNFKYSQTMFITLKAKYLYRSFQTDLSISLWRLLFFPLQFTAFVGLHGIQLICTQSKMYTCARCNGLCDNIFDSLFLFVALLVFVYFSVVWFHLPVWVEPYNLQTTQTAQKTLQGMQCLMCIYFPVQGHFL